MFSLNKIILSMSWLSAAFVRSTNRKDQNLMRLPAARRDTRVILLATVIEY